MLSTDDSKMQEGFVPGLIHFPNKIVFWKNELKASNWVMDTLRQGYMQSTKRRITNQQEQTWNLFGRQSGSGKDKG